MGVTIGASMVQVMTKPYISSIISTYGDTDQVKQDVKTLNEILGRQGDQLLLDVVAEHIGDCAIKFKMIEEETTRVKNIAVRHLKYAIEERL